MHAHRFADAPFGPGFRRGRGRGPGGRGAEAAPPLDRAEVAGWFAGRLPDGWFTGGGASGPRPRPPGPRPRPPGPRQPPRMPAKGESEKR